MTPMQTEGRAWWGSGGLVRRTAVPQTAWILLAVVVGFLVLWPVLQLQWRAFLDGGSAFGRMAELPRIGTAATAGAAAGPADEGLFERLRAWRLERARVDEVPAFVVLHDATLRELATAKPTSELDLAAVKGFGPTKLERYGEDVLAVIAAA